MPAKSAGYNDFIFINCPFDEEYIPLLHAIVFSIYRCGFVPQCAMGEDDGSDTRLDKIIRCIKNCRYRIHDISRIEVNVHNLPRFNMPFELGIFFGAKRFGETAHRFKNALIFEKTRFLYQEYISDLNGVDTKPIIMTRKLLFERYGIGLVQLLKGKTFPVIEFCKTNKHYLDKSYRESWPGLG